MTIDLRVAARARAPRLGDYSPELRLPAVATWHARMVNEFMSSEVFDALARQLGSAGFDPGLVEECASFAGEERRHGVLCGAVVEALGGSAVAERPHRPPFPLHGDAPARAGALRNVVHVCCMSETVAVALIGAERLEMPEGPLRDLLTTIYADEVGHARFGWRLLESVAASLNDEERLAVSRYLPTAFAHLQRHELAHLPDRDAPQGGECLGLCSGREARRLLVETVQDVIRPGLARWFSAA